MTELKALKFGLAGGIVTAICIFVSTLAVLIVGGGYGAEYMAVLESIYGFIGYKVSVLGAFSGAIYGFIDGFILTWIFALVYNKLAG